MTQQAEMMTGINLLLYSGAAALYLLIILGYLALWLGASGFLVRLSAGAARAFTRFGTWVGSLRRFPYIALGVLVIAIAGNIYQLADRWVDTSQPPFKTLYESLVLLAACIAVVYVVVDLVYRARLLGFPSALGSVVAMGFAFLSRDKDVVNLPPALQSGWFIPHVVVYFFGYAALVVATAAAIVYLVRPKPIGPDRPDLIYGASIDLEALLDTAVRFGFALLTVGLLVGAAWAKDAWGDYWVWDPKETWSLVTWLIFGGYLHLRYIGSWRGRRLALVVLVGFAAMFFTYLGMHLLPTADSSAHVYQ